MPEVRLIDANAVLGEIEDFLCGKCISTEEQDCEPCRCRILIEKVQAIPTIDAEPVKHGRWETWGYVFHGIEWKRCSACGKCAGVSYYGLIDGKIKMETPARCGCCGAKMDGGAENG